jgi:hypothetical protein
MINFRISSSRPGRAVELDASAPRDVVSASFPRHVP